MVTSVIGKIFLEAYNTRYKTSYNAEQFFKEKFYPLFFDSNKYLYWVQNSPFVQKSKGQKVETLTKEKRKENKGQKVETLTKEEPKEKLDKFIEKIEQGASDASVAIGYPASEEKEYNSTSGQVSNLSIPISKEDIYYSWFGAALGVGVEGGLSIFFYNEDILLDVFEGWEKYRCCLEANEKLKGNQITTWNGQWLAHRYSSYFDSDNYMDNFDPFTNKDKIISIKTVSWCKILIGIAMNKKYQDSRLRLTSYIYNYGQTNETLGFIPFELSEIRRPIQLYQELFFGMDSGREAEKLWGTAFGLKKACESGVIGLHAMEPKGLKDYIEAKKMPKLADNEEQKINFNVYQIWIMAMLNNQELWDKAQAFAKVLYDYSSAGGRAKTENANKVEGVLKATNKKNFIDNMVSIVKDTENITGIEEIASIVNKMPSDNVPYFLTLIRFHYAILNNTKNNK